jgi:hypothetical protein
VPASFNSIYPWTRDKPMQTGCAFSLTVCSPLITILVLDLKPPHSDAFGALLPLWPTGLAYAVS